MLRVLFPSLLGLTLAQAEFAHPGLLFSRADLDRIQDAVVAEQSPVYEGFEALVNDQFSRLEYQPPGPPEKWGRNPDIFSGQCERAASTLYQSALLWAINGDQRYADKARGILNSWVQRCKEVSGKDAVLATGLQGFKFVNAAELLRHTNSGWSAAEAKACEKWFLDVWLPTIENYASFANANWDAAALRMKMAIAIFVEDQEMFEETVRYAVAGPGNGSITGTIVYSSGQGQESTRNQAYAKLGLDLLTSVAEMAWNQGVDLYGWNANRLLRGWEYTCKYSLGEDVPYRHYLDRTGKYGFGGKFDHFTKLSEVNRDHFPPVFELAHHHYVGRRGLPAPALTRAVKKVRPEGENRDHTGFGTLRQVSRKAMMPPRAPGTPAGLLAENTEEGIKLSWVTAVEPASGEMAKSYSIRRASSQSGPFKQVASGLRRPNFTDEQVSEGRVYYYSVSSQNAVGRSDPSVPLGIGRGLPRGWKRRDIGAVGVAGTTAFNGTEFELDAEGSAIGGEADQFHFAYLPVIGDVTITARLVRSPSSQWSQAGVMIRDGLEPNAPHVSAMLRPQEWSGAMVFRATMGGPTKESGIQHLREPWVQYRNRLMKPSWLRVVRKGDRFTTFMSPDGETWTKLSAVEVSMTGSVYAGLPACSKLKRVTTSVVYDHVQVRGRRAKTTPR